MQDIMEYVPRERVDALADHVLQLSNALSLLFVMLLVSILCNCWQFLSTPSYSDAQRASLTALVDSLMVQRHESQ